MRKLTRRAVAGAMAAPLMLAALAGVSVADSSSYHKATTSADKHGARTKTVKSDASTGGNDGRGNDGRGNGGDSSSYRKATTSADKHGARTKTVKSDASTGGHNGHGNDGRGNDGHGGYGNDGYSNDGYGHGGYGNDGYGNDGYGHGGSVYSLSGYGQKDITVWFDSMFN